MSAAPKIQSIHLVVDITNRILALNVGPPMHHNPLFEARRSNVGLLSFEVLVRGSFWSYPPHRILNTLPIAPLNFVISGSGASRTLFSPNCRRM
jgi:hypothetical protein